MQKCSTYITIVPAPNKEYKSLLGIRKMSRKTSHNIATRLKRRWTGVIIIPSKICHGINTSRHRVLYVVQVRACLQEGGGTQVGEVICGGLPHLTCKRDHIKMRDYLERWVTSPTWGSHLHVNRPYLLNLISCVL